MLKLAQQGLTGDKIPHPRRTIARKREDMRIINPFRTANFIFLRQRHDTPTRASINLHCATASQQYAKRRPGIIPTAQYSRLRQSEEMIRFRRAGLPQHNQ